ncbi:hypothetical protein O3P69_016855 [Scylla paramamosain]|uniref:Uncharacterized protein n=1 Tax=Scylla paramamosain TaxID=85552 RepID=A0AAW0SYY3_SCYPA
MATPVLSLPGQGLKSRHSALSKTCPIEAAGKLCVNLAAVVAAALLLKAHKSRRGRSRTNRISRISLRYFSAMPEPYARHSPAFKAGLKIYYVKVCKLLTRCQIWRRYVKVRCTACMVLHGAWRAATCGNAAAERKRK